MLGTLKKEFFPMIRMQSAGRSPLVLVVDDHEDTRQMSLIVLRSQGFSAMAACGGEAGFVCACEQQPDVIGRGQAER